MSLNHVIDSILDSLAELLPHRVAEDFRTQMDGINLLYPIQKNANEQTRNLYAMKGMIRNYVVASMACNTELPILDTDEVIRDSQKNNGKRKTQSLYNFWEQQFKQYEDTPKPPEVSDLRAKVSTMLEEELRVLKFSAPTRTGEGKQ